MSGVRKPGEGSRCDAWVGVGDDLFKLTLELCANNFKKDNPSLH